MLMLKPRQPHGLVLAMSCSQLRQSYGCGVGDVEFTAKTVVRMWCWRCRVHSQGYIEDAAKVGVNLLSGVPRWHFALIWAVSSLIFLAPSCRFHIFLTGFHGGCFSFSEFIHKLISLSHRFGDVLGPHSFHMHTDVHTHAPTSMRIHVSTFIQSRR